MSEAEVAACAVESLRRGLAPEVEVIELVQEINYQRQLLEKLRTIVSILMHPGTPERERGKTLEEIDRAIEHSKALVERYAQTR